MRANASLNMGEFVGVQFFLFLMAQKTTIGEIRELTCWMATWRTYGTMPANVRTRRLPCAVMVLVSLAFVLLIVTTVKELAMDAWHHIYDEASHIYEGFEFAHAYTEAMGGVRNTARVLGGAAAAGQRYQTLCLLSDPNVSACVKWCCGRMRG